MIENQMQEQQQEPKKQRGCFFYGCLTLLILVVLGAGLFSYGIYKLYNKAYEFTSGQPAQLPDLKITDAEMQQVKQKFEDFRQALKNKKAQDLILTQRELNALVSSSPEFKGKVHFTIEDNQIKGKVSIPMGQIPGFSGRYFNATANFDASLENGILIVTIQKASVKGKEVPEEIMERVRQENLAKDIYKNKENAEMLRKFKSIKIQDGAIIFEAQQENK